MGGGGEGCRLCFTSPPEDRRSALCSAGGGDCQKGAQGVL